jgi:hypothetical protein
MRFSCPAPDGMTELSLAIAFDVANMPNTAIIPGLVKQLSERATRNDLLDHESRSER